MTRTLPPKRVLALPDLQQSKRLSRTASPQGASISQKVRLAFTDRAGAPRRICFAALSPACEWAPWIVLRCRLVGIGSHVCAWLSLFACQVRVAASLVRHGGFVRAWH